MPALAAPLAMATAMLLLLGTGAPSGAASLTPAMVEAKPPKGPLLWLPLGDSITCPPPLLPGARAGPVPTAADPWVRGRADTRGLRDGRRAGRQRGLRRGRGRIPRAHGLGPVAARV